MVHENSDNGVQCKSPLGCRDGRPLDGLLTLKTFAEDGHGAVNSKILVCVKSIGVKKRRLFPPPPLEHGIPLTQSTVKNKKGGVSELVNVIIFDNTMQASLTIWGAAVASVDPWRPSSTILLITNAGFSENRTADVSLLANTFVDVDPCMDDAAWLLKHAQKLTQRDHVNPESPEGGMQTGVFKHHPMH